MSKEPIETVDDVKAAVFQEVEKQDERDLMATKIFELEKRIIEIKNKITSKKVKVCNEENAYYDKVL